MMHIKELLLLIGKSSTCGVSGFPLSLSTIILKLEDAYLYSLICTGGSLDLYWRVTNVKISTCI